MERAAQDFVGERVFDERADSAADRTRAVFRVRAGVDQTFDDVVVDLELAALVGEARDELGEFQADDPAEFLADKGWGIPFAVDTEDDTLWKIVNGSSTLPQTVVLDRNGTVIYNQKGSVTPEMLAALYEQASLG